MKKTLVKSVNKTTTEFLFPLLGFLKAVCRSSFLNLSQLIESPRPFSKVGKTGKRCFCREILATQLLCEVTIKYRWWNTIHLLMGWNLKVPCYSKHTICLCPVSELHRKTTFTSICPLLLFQRVCFEKQCRKNCPFVMIFCFCSNN